MHTQGREGGRGAKESEQGSGGGLGQEEKALRPARKVKRHFPGRKGLESTAGKAVGTVWRVQSPTSKSLGPAAEELVGRSVLPLALPWPRNSVQCMGSSAHWGGMKTAGEGAGARLGRLRRHAREAGICPGDGGKRLRTWPRKDMGPVRYLRRLTQAAGQRPEVGSELYSHQAGERGVRVSSGCRVGRAQSEEPLGGRMAGQGRGWGGEV